jgi:hypothetical protein
MRTLFSLGLRPVSILPLALLLAACASTPPPTAQMAAAATALESAQRSGALDLAPVELTEARGRYERAQDYVKREEFDRARQLAEQATAEAQLAQARANAKRATLAVVELEKNLSALQSEAARGAASAVAVPPSTPPTR